MVPQRGLHADGRARLPRAQVPGGVRRRGRRLPARRRAHRGARRAAARAAWPPASARTSASPRRRSGSSAPRTRSSASSRRRSGARRSPRSGSPSPTPAPTSPASAPSPRRWTAATWSTGRRRSSPTACAPTSSSPPSRRREEGGHHGLSFLILEKDMEGYSRLEEAREAGLARLRHRRARVRGRVRARGEPARRGEQGLLPDHGQLPVGAAADGARRGRLDAARCSSGRSSTRCERSAFGRPIGKHQAIRHKIAEMAVKLRGRRARSPTTRCGSSHEGRTRSAR